MAQMPDPFPSLLARIKRMEDRLNQRLASSPFFGTGVHPDGNGGLVVEGLLNVTSGEVKSGDYVPGSAGWHLAANAVPEFNDIILRDLPNSMLANPIVPANAHADASNFSLSTSWVTKCSVTVPVPSGFTQALILAVSTGATAKNTTGSDDFFYASVSISALSGSLPGWVLGSPTVPAGKYGVTQDYSTVLLTGLSGSFTIDGQISTAFASWATDSGNKMNVDASILFLR